MTCNCNKNNPILAHGDANGRGKTTLEQLKEYYNDAEKHRKQIADFVYYRLYERYIEPFEKLIFLLENKQLKRKEILNGLSNLKLGFSIMANMCLLMETLQAFYDGEDGYFKKNAQAQTKAFKDFLTTHIKKVHITEKEAIAFYESVRCGILHQGETKGGWLINETPKIIDFQEKLVDSRKMLKVMKSILKKYQKELLDPQNNTLENCNKKIKHIIANCN